MALSAKGASLADQAVERVRAAVDAAQAALDAESSWTTWITGSESARQAREADLYASQKILAQLSAKRGLLFDDSEIPDFLQLAAAGANVSALLEESRRMTGTGFVDEVVKPTLHDANPLNLNGPVGRALVVGACILLAVYLFTRE